MLRGRADSLLGSVQDADDAEDNVMMDGTQVNLPDRDIFEVWDGRGVVLGKSANWDGFDSVAKLDSLGWKHKPFQNGSSSTGEDMAQSGSMACASSIPARRAAGSSATSRSSTLRPLEPVWEAIRDAVVFYSLTSLALLHRDRHRHVLSSCGVVSRL